MFQTMTNNSAWGELHRRLDLNRGFKGRMDRDMKLSHDYRRMKLDLLSLLGGGVRELNSLPWEPLPVSLASFRNRLRKYGHVFEKERVWMN